LRAACCLIILSESTQQDLTKGKSQVHTLHIAFDREIIDSETLRDQASVLARIIGYNVTKLSFDQPYGVRLSADVEIDNPLVRQPFLDLANDAERHPAWTVFADGLYRGLAAAATPQEALPEALRLFGTVVSVTEVASTDVQINPDLNMYTVYAGQHDDEPSEGGREFSVRLRPHE
jgi:hypothetical protein